MSGAETRRRERNKGVRWWPAVLVIFAAGLWTGVTWARESLTFQQKNMTTLGVLAGAVGAMILWWLFFSRVRWWRRALGFLGLLVVGGILALTVRVRGVTGDLVPILEWRWAAKASGQVGQGEPVPQSGRDASGETRGTTNEWVAGDFPQFLGPDRTGIVPGVRLDPDWRAHPPVEVWRRPVGAAWSGFAVVGNRAVTQEQQGDEEWVSCHDLLTGERLWRHADAERYATTIAGEGPRATPTIRGGRVYALGATGMLNCLDLEDGRLVWSVDLREDLGAGVPEWGFSGSPWVDERRVVVMAGAGPGKSLAAYDPGSGARLWTGGDAPAGYSSPVRATLDGVAQFVAFNQRQIEAVGLEDGAGLWVHPFGKGQPHVAQPVFPGDNRVLISAGYGVGAELLNVTMGTDGAWRVEVLWKSNRLKSKFSSPVHVLRRVGAETEDMVLGLDDGILAAVDPADGSLLWKEGRHGHGQGLLLGSQYLLMAESGELVLLRPTREGPGELGRFRVFRDKTWNPIALAGDLLLVRNDQEAACLRVRRLPPNSAD